VSTEPPIPIARGRRGPLVAALRRREMLRRIETEGGGGVAELARIFGVSTVTIHRDLEILVGEGVVERVRGGVRPLAVADTQPQGGFERRLGQATEAKCMIAASAALLVNEGSTVFLDASTTCFALARELERIAPAGVTLVTNSPAIAFELHAASIHVIVTPGEIDQNLRLIGGRWTVEFIAGLNFETAFISGLGLTLENGLTTGQRNITDVLHAARAVAQETVALVDASKFGINSLLTIAAVDEIDRLIVDEAVDRSLLAGYEQAGVRVTVARSAGAFREPDGADRTAWHEDGVTSSGPTP
jgi:DeoR/GlpR family transcriptional regulator of sugar metabolism